MSEKAIELAQQLRDKLSQQQQRLVLAESCTAGRVAATLAVLPGISNWLCGGFVVYRNDSKARWLGISQMLLDDPAIGPVSAQASAELAIAALGSTPEASWAVAVTGDVGPGVPGSTDGVVFLAAALRHSALRGSIAEPNRIEISDQCRIDLAAPAPQSPADWTSRLARLEEATERTLAFALRAVVGDAQQPT